MTSLAMGVGALAPSNAVANAAGSQLTLFSLLFAATCSTSSRSTQALQAAGAAGDLMGGAWTVMAALAAAHAHARRGAARARPVGGHGEAARAPSAVRPLINEFAGLETRDTTAHGGHRLEPAAHGRGHPPLLRIPQG